MSNWSIPYLEKLEKQWSVVPAVNQVELHPFNPQHKLKEFCEAKGILLEAYCPLGSTDSPLLTDPKLGKIAKAHDVAPAKVLISYQVQRGAIVLPKSVTPARITTNLETIELTKEDMAVLDDIGTQKRVNTPAFGWDLGFDDWYGAKA